ncbi:Mediator complex, subunit Med4 [Cordyceps fumosorosea ARSEF 2679]|uniref:Mediator of RNA polymerase II transcription subunit 4 n=1 Tax=Cordyceps fumosorosea (strain ARSEF 2679) TaxID=1081104 RepID=A0A168B2P3_CORFA|nr:Mediator complex, subunit Med4 [Cordyceps fumosorosea ARSEF 2679]OAA69536.1 Mediator complex, subunit Med4 [Cordyceps fumosorosea ARSEF 2679]
MDKFIDGRFERLEKALTSLIDSVTKYHPSMNLAEEVVAADAELTKGLEQVQTHQNNHLRILELREASASLDTQIRDTLTSLANARRDIVNTHTTKFPSAPNYPIAYEELLSYARRISKTTMPPAGTINASVAPSGLQSPTVGESQSQAVTPAPTTPAAGATPGAATTPATTTPLPTQSPAAVNGVGGGAQHPHAPQQGGSSSGPSLLTSLPEPMAQYLNPLSGQVFFPWPLEDKIRSGSLAANQVLVEKGIDPRGFDPVAEEERKRREEAERKEREEREAREQQERDRLMREERERARLERERQREKEQEEWRRASVVAGTADAPGAAAPKAPEKKQFQFTNLDDLDDDDDDD